MTSKKYIVFNGKTLYSIPAIAEMTGYHPHHLRMLCREQKITAEKIGPRAWWLDKNLVLSQLRSAGSGGLTVENYELAREEALQKLRLRELGSDL